MHILFLALSGLAVGATVGLTGMGGGALMTPLLIFGFGMPPLSAVSTDLVTSLVMKPVGAAVHSRQGTIHWQLVRWLCAGSVPAALIGVALIHVFGNSKSFQHWLGITIGVALILAVCSMITKALLTRHRDPNDPETNHDFTIRPIPTLLIGALGGLAVGMTSVGSGSLILVLLLFVYPTLSAGRLVGTDLAQAVPLIATAAIGHLFLGAVSFSTAGALLIGALPGTYLGARLSARAPTDASDRP